MAHAALIGAGIGAWWLIPFPAWVVLASLVFVATKRSPLSVAVALLLATSFLGQRALAGLDPPEPGPVDGWITLLDDPRPAGPYGIRFTARLGNRRVSVNAHGPVAGRLDDLLAGEQVHVVGTVRPVRAGDSWAKWRHEVGRVTVGTVVNRASGSPVARLANSIRRTLSRGAEVMSRRNRALYLGMVIGDDRDQTAATADDFRAAGLGHLLVVSGQNVAFVLAIMAPVVVGLRPGPRLLILVGVLLLFSVLTRFEPSVLRAVAMAGVGIGTAALGTPIEGRRGLSWAIVGLLLLDPFLVHVLAFQLSAAATAGIVWWSGPLAERLRGPAWFRIPFATTVAAQLAVSPLLVLAFGPMPLASLPANLLAGPMSGPVMVWGSTAGMVAGLSGSWLGTLIHIPTTLMLGWIGGVAAISARAPQAMLAPASLVALSASAIGLVIGGGRLRWAASLTAAMVCGIAVVGAPSPPSGVSVPTPGVEVWRIDGQSLVVLNDPGNPREVLAALRMSGAGKPDLVVATDGDAADAFVVLALAERFGRLAIVAPALHRVPDARTVRVGDRVVVGPVSLTISDTDPLDFFTSPRR